MKASFPMFFYYLGMMGVPVVLLLLALSALLGLGGAVQLVLLVLAAAGSLAYGLVAIREALLHGKGRIPM
jgi:hypothetical protein